MGLTNKIKEKKNKGILTQGRGIKERMVKHGG